MTQFGQNPSQPPMYYGYAQADPYAGRGWGPTLKVCRAAAIVQAVLGGLMLFLGCCGGLYGMAFSMQLDGLSGEQVQQLEEAREMLGEHGVRALLFDGCSMMAGSLLQLALVWWVWGGRRWAIWTSMGAAGLVIVVAMGILAYSLAQGMAMGLCFNGMLVLLEAGLVVLLGFALREATRAEAAAATYAAQWQQYYQQYQASMYQQGVPPQAAPPAPSTPPAQPAPPVEPPPPPAAPEPPGKDQPGDNPPNPPAV